jgi:hypothetical protein
MPEPIPGDLHLADDMERAWRMFLAGVLSETVSNCRWLSFAAKSPKKCDSASAADNFGRRLVCSAVAWNWVFSKPDCVLGFRQVCEDLNLEEDYIRRRILADCSNPEDINKVVLRTIQYVLPTFSRRACPTDALGEHVDWSIHGKARAL